MLARGAVQVKAEVESAAFLHETLEMFNKVDTDRSHMLEPSEVKAAFKQFMSDAGMEGKLSKTDVGRILAGTQRHSTARGPWLVSFFIPRPAHDPPAPLFTVFDEDHSGTISFTEFLEMHQVRRCPCRVSFLPRCTYWADTASPRHRSHCPALPLGGAASPSALPVIASLGFTGPRRRLLGSTATSPSRSTRATRLCPCSLPSAVPGPTPSASKRCSSAGAVGRAVRDWA